MIERLVIGLIAAVFALTVAACGAATRNAAAEKGASAEKDAAAEVALPPKSSLDAWASGTGAFFKAVGPGGGSGVMTGWPQ